MINYTNYRHDHKFLLKICEIPDVDMPSWRAVSAKEAPYSLTNFTASVFRRPGTGVRRLPDRSVCMDIFSCRQTAAISSWIFFSRSDAEIWYFILSPACARRPETKSPLPSMRSSPLSLLPCFRMDLTTDHPPMDRINPPPVNSGCFPRAIPF